jgi:hypothetical protein
MKRRLSVLEQRRLLEARWLRQRGRAPEADRLIRFGRLREVDAKLNRGRLRERQVAHPRRLRERAAARQRQRMAALARRRPDLTATVAFWESYFGARLRSRRAPGHSAIQAFKESLRRPAR